MKLELKHISPYLPYRINCLSGIIPIINKKELWEIVGTGIRNEDFYIKGKRFDYNNIIRIWPIKPVLRPLSDLTKEIEVNGEKFVPLVELLKIGINVHVEEFKNIEFKIQEETFQITVDDNKQKKLVFAFDNSDKSFGSFYLGKTYSVFRQLELFEKIFEWHFDVFDLIGAGLAIDINTLKNDLRF